MMDGPRRWASMLAIALALVLPTLVTLVYFVMAAGQTAWLQYTAFGVGKSVQFAFPLFWVLVVEGRRPRMARPATCGLSSGLTMGVAVLLGTLVLYHAVLKPHGLVDAALVPVRQKVGGLGIDRLWQCALMTIFYALCHALLEEYYWRWFVFGQLRRICAVGWAMAISSVGFMAHHVLVLGVYFGWLSPVTYLLSLAVAVGGAFWAWLYQSSGSLYAPWLSHCLIDVAIFVVGYDMVRPQLG